MVASWLLVKTADRDAFDLIVMRLVVWLVEKMSSERVKRVIGTVTRLQDYVSRICQLDVDETEYAYLKSLVLFSPGEVLLCNL